MGFLRSAFMTSSVALAILVGVFIRYACFFHKCPSPLDLQTDYVRNNFNISKFEGFWYELAYHDWTQPREWCGCQTSRKTMSDDGDMVKDLFRHVVHGSRRHFPYTFSLYCYNATYLCDLQQSLTDTRAHFGAHWRYFPWLKIPNTLVAVGLDPTDNWRWVIEYQCLEVPFLDIIGFVGINFYHRENQVPKEELQEMFDVARRQGLSEYMDTGFKTTILDHTNCVYPGDK